MRIVNSYISTRGAAPALGFDEVLLRGLAPDGGLYVPASLPGGRADDLRALAGLSYAEAARAVIAPFMAGSALAPDLAQLLAQSFGAFAHKAVAPLVQIDSNHFLLELFHGPTLAFKDYALQFVGRLFDALLKQRGERVTVVGATSGDTGSAAIEALRDRAAVDVFILHPKGRVSDVQRRQMTTVTSANVHNIAIEGTFDDCQALVKAMFADRVLRDDLRLAAVNSINWARVMAQIVYYMTAGVALGAPERPVAFSVPTGNFGNVYAGYVARALGLPAAHFVVASNRNDILTRFFATGRMRQTGVEPSLSPSMDIQVSSNFERLLFDLLGRSGEGVSRLMADFARSGEFVPDAAAWQVARRLFSGYTVDDATTLAAIGGVYRDTGLLVDPHTAVGIAAAGRARSERAVDSALPMITLATAHPAKFPDAVERATGIRPGLPPHLVDLFERRERYVTLPNDLAAVSRHVREAGRLKGAA